MNPEDRLIVATSTLSNDPPVGLGLFACDHFKRGEIIATFVGIRRTINDYDNRCLQGLGGYAVALRNGDVLDCYDGAKSGRCLASMANHSGENGFGAQWIRRLGGLGVGGYIPAKSNAHIQVSGSVVKLISGRIYENFGDSDSDDDDDEAITINIGDEILWNYNVTRFLN
jgi:hypothetical protein